MKIRPKGTKDELKEKLELIKQIASTVQAYYLRMRSVYPFPMEPLEVYDAALSKRLRNLATTPIDSPTAADESWAQALNMRGLFTMGPKITFTLDKEQRVHDCIHHNAHLRRVFWVDMPHHVPAPTGPTFPALLIPEQSRVRHLLGEWYFTAMRFSTRSEEDIKLIRDVIQKSRLPEVLERVWPELLLYGKLQPANPYGLDDLLIGDDSDLINELAHRAGASFSGSSTTKQVETIREKYGPKIDAQRARIANTIATASLITEVRINAWVGWPMK